MFLIIFEICHYIKYIFKIYILWYYLNKYLLEKSLPIHWISELFEDTLEDDTTIILQPLVCNTYIAS